MKARILYLNPIGEFSGACVSLINLVRSSPLSGVQPLMLTPAGSAADYFREQGCQVIECPRLSQFDHTRYGRYRGLRWLVALRELVLLPRSYLAMRAIARQVGPVDLIHLNEITGIVVGTMLQCHLRAPMVMHVRAHMGDQRGWRSRFLWELVRRHVATSFCIDETVAETVPATINKVVVHNGAARVEPSSEAVARWASVLAETPAAATRVAIVGSLLPVKGVYEFVEAAIRICRERRDLCFLIVGKSVRRFGRWSFPLVKLGLVRDVEGDCRRRIEEEGMESHIMMTGHVREPIVVYRTIDILCFPSHYNACGRPVFEAALEGKPAIVAIERSHPDTLIPGETGIAIPARSVAALADAIVELAGDSVARLRMGAAARKLAQKVSNLEANGEIVRSVYGSLLPDQSLTDRTHLEPDRAHGC
jgi:glycosyltransferase involved in cell wall biosynthesis